MNAHILQSYTAIEEARVLFNAGYNLVSTQSGSPCNGLVQDALNGLYIMTNAWFDSSYTKQSYLKIPVSTFLWVVYMTGISLTHLEDTLRRAHRYYPKYVNPDSIPRTSPYFKKSHIPTTLLVSLLFPPTLRFKVKTEDAPSTRQFVNIRHGILLPNSAPLTKKLVGPGGLLLHWIWHSFSCDDAVKFASSAEHMVYHWLVNHGLSLGPSDCYLSSIDLRNSELEKLRIKYQAIQSQSISSADKENSIDALLSSFNNAILTPIVRNHIQKRDRNSFVICEKSGAKGAVVNLIHTAILVGQQSVNGGRIPMQCSRQRRTLPCYTYDNESLESRGFVSHNYIEGLTPQETFFHAMVGRKGLISTGIKTSDTGYIQKCMSRKMEDLVVQLDLTVRDANGCIIDFFYGGDGADPRRLLKTAHGRMPMDLVRMAQTLQDQCTQWSNKKQELRVLCGQHHTTSPLTEDQLETMIQLIRPCHPGIKTSAAALATRQLHEKLREVLKTVSLCDAQKITFVVIMKQMVEAAIVAYGTNVGLIASSSMASPVMQLTLSSFRMPGVKTRDTTNGVIRLKELLNTTKTKDQKKPSCLVYPSFEIQERIVNAMKMAKLSDNATHRMSARLYAVHQLQDLRFSLQYTLLKDLVSSWTLQKTNKSVKGSSIGLIQYDLYEKPWWVALYESYRELALDWKKTWVLIMQLDANKMYQRFTMEDITTALQGVESSMVTVIPSPSCINQLHILINDQKVRSFESSIPANVSRGLTPDSMSYHFAKYVLTPHLQDIHIAGLPGIQQVTPMEDPKTHEWYLDVACKSKTNNQSIHRYHQLLAEEHIDASRTIVDDIHTLLEVLGIEAAQEYFSQETGRVLNYDADSRHIDLLTRSMTFHGYFTAASRHGMKQSHQPFSRILFETHVEQATTAAFQNEYDVGTGVAVSVMLGKQAPRVGTGAVVAQPIV